MFSLTVIDHVRLDSEHIARNYTVHARSAERIVGLVFAGRITMTVLLAIATASAVAAVIEPSSRGYQMAAAVATAGALLAFVIYTVLGLEGRLFAHRSFAQRLWLMSERYRSLLAEAHDGGVDESTLLRRRDELIRDVHAIYEYGFGADQAGYERLRLPELPDQRAA